MSIANRGKNLILLKNLQFMYLYQNCNCQPFLTLFETNTWFYMTAVKVFWKVWGKEEIAGNKHFLVFSKVFYPFQKLSTIYIKFEIVVCKLFQFGKVKIVNW